MLSWEGCFFRKYANPTYIIAQSWLMSPLATFFPRVPAVERHSHPCWVSHLKGRSPQPWGEAWCRLAPCFRPRDFSFFASIASSATIFIGKNFRHYHTPAGLSWFVGICLRFVVAVCVCVAVVWDRGPSCDTAGQELGALKLPRGEDRAAAVLGCLHFAEGSERSKTTVESVFGSWVSWSVPGGWVLAARGDKPWELVFDNLGGPCAVDQGGREHSVASCR